MRAENRLAGYGTRCSDKNVEMRGLYQQSLDQKLRHPLRMSRFGIITTNKIHSPSSVQLT